MQRFFVNANLGYFSFILIFLFSFIENGYSKPNLSAQINRSVLLSGFHRILHYNITLPDVRGPTQILIEETLPKDVYLDPYQLSERIEGNEIKIITDKPINSEIPAYQAESFSIQLCSVSQTNSHQIELPIHLRYQKPQECKVGGYSVSIKLGDAVIYVRSANDGLTNTKCFNIENDNSWIEKVKLQTSLQVPVGCAEHLYVVFSCTIIVVVANALYICYVLIKLNKKL